tara:strand:+ start:405 stop:740 length:336 start_codon:yes stop_codon:yes gene_type:complete
MKHQEQRIAIAEASEIHNVGYRDGTLTGYNANRDLVDVPDYLNDLNATHQAKILIAKDWPDFWPAYWEILKEVMDVGIFDDEICDDVRRMVAPDATQESKAILLAVKLWTE